VNSTFKPFLLQIDIVAVMHYCEINIQIDNFELIMLHEIKTFILHEIGILAEIHIFELMYVVLNYLSAVLWVIKVFAVAASQLFKVG